MELTSATRDAIDDKLSQYLPSELYGVGEAKSWDSLLLEIATGECVIETLWCGSDGIWVDVWLSSEPPAAAKTLIYKSNSDKPFTGVAKFDSYKQNRRDRKLFRRVVMRRSKELVQGGLSYENN